jgi:RecB family exonuclease
MDEFMSELEVHPSSTIIFPGSIDRVEKDNSGYGAVYQYLETECTKGTYTREEYEDFFVYRVN